MSVNAFPLKSTNTNYRSLQRVPRSAENTAMGEEKGMMARVSCGGGNFSLFCKILRRKINILSGLKDFGEAESQYRVTQNPDDRPFKVRSGGSAEKIKDLPHWIGERAILLLVELMQQNKCTERGTWKIYCPLKDVFNINSNFEIRRG